MKIKLLKKDQAIIAASDLSKIVLAKEYLNNRYHLETENLNVVEAAKKPLRSDIINILIRSLNRTTSYLEIGVRHKVENFALIDADIKVSVDPGYESEINDVDYKMTSDEFFQGLRNGIVLPSDRKFDVIFIDGSHLADQVDRDIINSLEFLATDGFIVMHDCNPPTEFHASENYHYRLSPSGDFWNGTTWKAFFKARQRTDISSCCIDTDWGIGIISKSLQLGQPSIVKNEFYEYHILEENRNESLNLISFEYFKKLI